MQHALNWFEIPTRDIKRAQTFYETIFQINMTALDLPQIQMRMFPLDNPLQEVGGALVQSAGFYEPDAARGPLLYLNGNPDVQLVLDRVVAAGGTILVPKTTISGEYGDMAVILDTEGNRIALHNVPTSKR